MISWIKGEFICSWLNNQKYFVLINCQGLGYEIQTSYLINNHENIELILWLHHIRREDSEYLYGFKLKEERDFFRDLINIKGIGPQIGMSLFNKYGLNEVIDALSNDDRKLINSVPGIGQKMTERIFLELRSKINYKNTNLNSIKKINLKQNEELENLIEDLKIALKSLDYPKKDIQDTISILLKDLKDIENSNLKSRKILNFEYLFKKSLNLLENN
ncbi:MAG: Holliday junction branch migration protein RuvA [Prochlorococcus sp. SP3034]|nr:Holliday junction branch migration protein RuvA [Prochlorococcus sp. SP3034]